ncbi:MAG: Lrp/AsnC family transcriptional regulator [Nanoarchaeota archaeon]
MNLTESEKRIINVLIKDSRKSYRDIAKESKVSIATISNKMKLFNKEGIINGHTTLIDYDKLNYDLHVMISVKVSQGKEVTVEKKLFNNPNVTSIYDITGEFDVLVIARFKNKKSLDNYLKAIQAYEFVERTQTNLILNTIKERPIELS